MVVVNGLLLRRQFLPLERLAGQMESADVLRGGQRLPVTSPGEIGRLERTFNAMLGLAQERRAAGTYALQAQEAERERLARGLHDEVGQSMTAVLLQLKRLAANASPEQRTHLAEAQEVVKTSLDDVRRLAQELRPEARPPRTHQRTRQPGVNVSTTDGAARPAHFRARAAPARPDRRVGDLPGSAGKSHQRRPPRTGNRNIALARAPA
jgi:hypothetical protein